MYSSGLPACKPRERFSVSLSTLNLLIVSQRWIRDSVLISQVSHPGHVEMSFFIKDVYIWGGTDSNSFDFIADVYLQIFPAERNG